MRFQLTRTDSVEAEPSRQSVLALIALLLAAAPAETEWQAVESPRKVMTLKTNRAA